MSKREQQRRRVGRNTHVVAPLDPMAAHRIEAKRQENQRRARAVKAKRVAQRKAEADAKRREETIAAGRQAKAELEELELLELGAARRKRELLAAVAEGEAQAEAKRSADFRAELGALSDSPEDRAKRSRMMGDRLLELGLDPHGIGYSPSAHVGESERYRDPLPRRAEPDARTRARQDARLRAAGIGPGGVVLPGGGGHKSF